VSLYTRIVSCGTPARIACVSTAVLLFTTSVFAQAPNAGAGRVRNLNNELLRVHGEAQKGSRTGMIQLRRQAAGIIEQRATVLSELIQTDPAQALGLAFSPELLADLAEKFPDSAGQLESHGTWQGSYEQWVYDSADLKSSRTVTRMNVGTKPLELHFAGQQPKALKSGDMLQAEGVVVGSKLVAATNSIQATTAQSCSTTGVQNTAVLLVTFPNVALPTGVTTQSLTDTFFGSTGHSLDGFLREASYGQTSAAGSVFGPYTLTGAYSSCSDVGGAVLNDAIAAATAGGVNLQNYSRVFLVLPDVLGCGWAGFASSGCSLTSPSGTFNASTAYIAASYAASRDQGVALAAHELGHNFGLLHSGTLTAATPSDVLGPLSSPGTKTDTGDFWSTMGATLLGLYPAPQKADVLGWLAPNTNYQAVQSSGTYTLQPLEISPPGLQALKVQRGTGNNAWLWIEYRQPLGNYDSTLFTQPFSGALIHYEDSNAAVGQTYLPNFTPTDTTRLSPALVAGQTWADPYSNVSLSVLSATPSGLTVGVNYGSVPCTRINPTVTMSPANPSVSAGSNVSYSVSVTNNDASSCSGSTFNLASAQPAGWSANWSATAVALNPGQTASVTLAESIPSATVAGTYGVNSSVASVYDSASGAANCTVVAAPSLADSLSVSPSTISAHQTVFVTATVLYGSLPAVGATVNFTLTKSNGTILSGVATTDSIGRAVWTYKVVQKDPVGTYSVTSKANYSAQMATSNSITFSVQ
jgi:M6 family metalloprotease-like protein